ncbi:MAG: cupin domain-containing protein [Bacteroidota bacterium]
MELEKVKITEKFREFSDYWSPKVVGELNGQLVKIAKFKGEFVMHHHKHEDEFFYVIAGELYIELKNKTLHLGSGDFIIIPKGTDHKPYAPEEVHVMLFEPSSTLNTGNVDNHLTKSDLDKI